MTDDRLSPKRRRIAKACMLCRRRKIKCTGTQPCSSCQTMETACFYDADQLSPASYITTLEKRVCDLEQLLNAERTNNGLPSDRWTEQSPTDMPTTKPEPMPLDPAPDESLISDEDMIETMIGTRESDVVDSRSLGPYHSDFAGLSLLRRVQNLCRHLSGIQRTSATEELEDDFIHAFNFKPPGLRSSFSGQSLPLLPPPDSIDRAIDVVVNQACCNMYFLDADTLRSVSKSIYAEADSESLDHDEKGLALLYAVLALAKRFEPTATKRGGATGNVDATGLKFFCACRGIVDPAFCHDLISLQALLCMIMYAQVSSMMSTCYSYVCIAVSACFQLGFYTDVAPYGLSEREKLCRRRIFTSLNIMDTYVTIALGLPKTLRDVVSEQALPTPTKPPNITDPLAGTYAHAQLIQILASAVESIHPATRPMGQKNGFYGVPYSKIVAIERRLEAWFAELSPFPSNADMVDDAIAFRSQLLLRLSYAHVQMVLYKPFLFHVLKIQRPSHSSLKAYACGSACIKAAMQVVWLTEKLEACGMFNEAQWWTTLIVAFTASCLTLFTVTNKTDPTLNETADAVRRIKELCCRHADRNASMMRCSKFLASLPTNGESESEHPISDSLNKFTPGSYWEPSVAESEEISGSEMLQALNLPFHVHTPEMFCENMAEWNG